MMNNLHSSEMFEPLISIIIPSYNHGHLIENALNSVINQTYKNWEIIIVDNNSQDNTAAIVSSFGLEKQIRFLKIDNGGIIGKSRNYGIKNSNGEFIAFLDSDDWWHPNKLSESVRYLEKKADLVYHDLWLVRNQGQSSFREKVRTRNLSTPVFEDLLLKGNAITNSSVVIRKSILFRIGLLSEDPDFIAWEDFDCWLRVSMETEKFVKVPKILGYYWLGGGNTSNSERTIKILNEILLRYSKHFQMAASKGLYPSWIDYGILVAKIELGLLDFKNLISNLNYLSFQHKIKIIFKYFFFKK
ncbi:glycosyltransferase [Leptospira sp. 96542]|nr:glycosyltransferase [Leptospira sp. 96542]